jgi:hypothetical protein
MDNKGELLEFAIKHYPKGIEYVSCVSRDTYISTGSYYLSDGATGVREYCQHNPWLFYNGNWARIISSPIIKQNYYFY